MFLKIKSSALLLKIFLKSLRYKKFYLSITISMEEITMSDLRKKAWEISWTKGKAWTLF